jgi:malate permease and related proteins
MNGILDITYEILLPIFVVAGAGGIYARTISSDTRPLGNLLFFILIPALITDGLANEGVSQTELLQVFGFVALLSLVMAALAWGVARLLGLGPASQAAFVLAVMLMNAANYGIPVNEFAFGDAGREGATLYYISAAIVANTAGILIASSGSMSVGAALAGVVRTPIFGATVLGIGLNVSGIALPVPLERGLGTVAAATIPIMLLLLGAQLAQIRLEGRLLPILAGSALRLVVSPLVAVALVMVFGFEGTLRDVAIVESAMPTAVFVVVLTERYQTDPALGTAIILVSTLASIVTLSVVLALV